MVCSGTAQLDTGANVGEAGKGSEDIAMGGTHQDDERVDHREASLHCGAAPGTPANGQRRDSMQACLMSV